MGGKRILSRPMTLMNVCVRYGYIHGCRVLLIHEKVLRRIVLDRGLWTYLNLGVNYWSYESFVISLPYKSPLIVYLTKATKLD